MATDRTPFSTGKARLEEAGEPSRAEIQQRVSSLYDRAETDTGTFNATRAMKSRTRRTVTSVANSGRRAADPSLDAVARQWFDVARGRLGPTTPATLPADRLPDRPAGDPRPPQGPQQLSDRGAARELEAGGRRELESGGRPVPELTGGRAVAALPAVPEPRQEASTALLPALVAAPPVTPASPGAPQTSLRSGKEQIRQKLTAAREMLARSAPQPTASLPSVESRPVQQPWDSGELPAYRSTADAWAGQQPAGGADPSARTDGGGFFPTTGTGLTTPSDVSATNGAGFGVSTMTGTDLTARTPAPATNGAGLAVPAYTPASASATNGAGLAVPGSAFAAPAPVLPPTTSAFPPPEPGLLAASYGDLLAPAPAATALPTPELSVPVPEFTLPTTGLPAPAPAPAPVPAPAPAEATTHGTGTAYLGKAEKALAFARAQIGRPCVWGATGPESYDCSSLTQAAWKAAGVTLPRTAIDQARAFTRVGLDELQPGDLVFFHDDLSHTGLCTGNGMMIHAPGPGSSIREESLFAPGEGALRGAVRPS